MAQHKLFEKNFYKKMFNNDSSKDANNNEPSAPAKKPAIEDATITQKLKYEIAFT